MLLAVTQHCKGLRMRSPRGVLVRFGERQRLPDWQQPKFDRRTVRYVSSSRAVSLGKRFTLFIITVTEAQTLRCGQSWLGRSVRGCVLVSPTHFANRKWLRLL